MSLLAAAPAQAAYTHEVLAQWELTPPPYDNPIDVAEAADGSFYVLLNDAGPGRVKHYSADGELIATWDEPIEHGVSIAVGPDSTVYVAEPSSGLIKRFSADGELLTSWWAGTTQPQGVAVDQANGWVYATYPGESVIRRFLPWGLLLDEWPVRDDEGWYTWPGSIDVAPDGTVFVEADGVRRYAPWGEPLGGWSWESLPGPWFSGMPLGLSVASDGTVYVSSPDHNKIGHFTEDGTLLDQWGMEGPAPGEYMNPRGVDVCADDTVLITDTFNARVQRATPGAETPVVFEDPGLEWAVRAELGVPQPLPLYPSRMRLLTNLDASGMWIRSLAGLEYAINLRTVDVSDNELTSIEPLTNATRLQELHFDRNRVATIWPLMEKWEMTTLSFSENPIPDLYPLMDMQRLRTLIANDCEIVGLEGLEHLFRLETVRLDGNEIVDMRQLSNAPEMRTLDLSDNRIENFQPFGWGLMERLELDGNQISDITAIAQSAMLDSGDVLDVSRNMLDLDQGSWNLDQITQLLSRGVLVTYEPQGNLPVHIMDPELKDAICLQLHLPREWELYESDMLELTTLDAQGRGIWSLEGLEEAKNLQTLMLPNNNIVDLSPIAGLSKLTFINVRNNQIYDVSPLSGLTELGELWLDGQTGWQRISDIGPLASLTKLTYLGLEHQAIEDISAVASMPYLSWLQLSGNPITDFTPLLGHSRLSFLTLSGMPQVDLGVVSRVPSVSWLEIEACDLTDITQLAGLPKLGLLDIGDNKVRDISVLRGATHLRTLRMEGNRIADISPLVENAAFKDGAWVDASENFLDLREGSDDLTDIAALTGRDVRVISEPQNWFNPHSVTPDPHVQLGFENVIDPGTSAAVPGLGHPAPEGYRLVPGTYYDITTTADFTGDAHVTIIYDEDALPGADENEFKIMHWENGAWRDITVGIETNVNYAHGETRTFSPFAVFAPAAASEPEPQPIVSTPASTWWSIPLLAFVALLVTTRRKGWLL